MEIDPSYWYMALILIATLALCVLKLINQIDWKWIWVLSPLWVSLSVSVLMVVVRYAVGMLYA